MSTLDHAQRVHAEIAAAKVARAAQVRRARENRSEWITGLVVVGAAVALLWLALR